MIRFYCTECKTVKRARRMPASVDNPRHTDPERRIGQCRWHTTSFQGTHREFLGHARRRHPVTVTRSAPLAPSRPQPKKKNRVRVADESAA